MSALVFRKEIRLPCSADDNREAFDERTRSALGLDPLEMPLSVLKLIPGLAGSAPLSCIVGRTGAGYKLIDAGRRSSCSIALDLGTTNLAGLLYDNIAQADVLTLGLENPQITFGSDILTRMHHAMAGSAREVYDSLREGVNRLIGMMCEKAGIKPASVHAVAVAGNTAMSHFFLGLPVATIPAHPFMPAVKSPGFFSAAALGLAVHPEAIIYVFPNAGSYVGGDIVSGIIAAGLDRVEHPAVLIDVGTNAEVVIGTRDWMIVGAGAAGPALEEGITRIGRRASSGIIYDVAIEGGKTACRTFDDRPPEGICGSGMISLVHALYVAGAIDQTGTLNAEAANVTDRGGERAYAIDCGRGEPLLVRQSEIRNFMKSKAAMFTLLLVLVRSVGICFRDVSHVFVSGALGTGIDAAKAEAIGMLPGWPPAIVTPLGNTSLMGARMLLVDGGLPARINAVTRNITYKHMHDDPEFMKEFLGAVFIPHTNPELLRAE